MAGRADSKRQLQFDLARDIAEAIGKPFLAPQILFNRATDDDLKRYTPEMLAYSAMHSATELAKWIGKTPRVNIEPVAHVDR